LSVSKVNEISIFDSYEADEATAAVGIPLAEFGPEELEVDVLDDHKSCS